MRGTSPPSQLHWILQACGRGEAVISAPQPLYKINIYLIKIACSQLKSNSAERLPTGSEIPPPRLFSWPRSCPRGPPLSFLSCFPRCFLNNLCTATPDSSLICSLLVLVVVGGGFGSLLASFSVHPLYDSPVIAPSTLLNIVSSRRMCSRYISLSNVTFLLCLHLLPITTVSIFFFKVGCLILYLLGFSDYLALSSHTLQQLWKRKKKKPALSTIPHMAKAVRILSCFPPLTDMCPGTLHPGNFYSGLA